jgi:hypothetical protein
MRTKLLAAAALLAAGVATSMAQSNVYSLNIVGYVNVTPSGSLTAMSNPLRAGTAGNIDRADQVIPYADGNSIQVWTGVGWNLYGMDSLSGTGWVDANGADVPLANLPVLGAGKGFFYANNIGVTTITLVGEVRTGTNNVAIPSGLSALGSPLPLGGKVATGAPNLQVQDGDSVQFWSGTGWTLYGRDSLSGTTWVDGNGADTPEPSLAVGQGFFYGNNVGPFNWQQILNP